MKRAEDMNHDEACAWLDKMLKSNTKIPQWRVEIGYCGEVAAMFERLVNCAGEAADGKPSKMDLSPEGWPRWVATVAAVYARKDPFKVAWGNIPDTCAELNKALDTLARLDATADGDAKRAEARRMEVEWAKLHGAARVREAWLLDRARIQAEDEVRIAEWKVKLAATEEERDKAEKDLAEARDNRDLLEKIKQGQVDIKAEMHSAFRRGGAEIALALDTPAKMAAELLTLARKEMSAEGVVLWNAYTSNGHSIKAAAKSLKKPYVTMNRLFHKEVDPFMKGHGLAVNTTGRDRTLEFNEQTDRARAKDARAGYHGPHTVGNEDGD